MARMHYISSVFVVFMNINFHLVFVKGCCPQFHCQVSSGRGIRNFEFSNICFKIINFVWFYVIFSVIWSIFVLLFNSVSNIVDLYLISADVLVIELMI